MPDDQTTAKDVPWHWPEEKWRGIVNKVRAGRSLKPKSWPGGAKVGVALSFDSDHETSTLRFGESSPGKLSQGEYGSRVGVRRIRECLARHDIKASFFVPAVVAELHPDEQKAVIDDGHEVGIHGWIHEFNSDWPFCNNNQGGSDCFRYEYNNCYRRQSFRYWRGNHRCQR